MEPEPEVCGGVPASVEDEEEGTPPETVDMDACNMGADTFEEVLRSQLLPHLYAVITNACWPLLRAHSLRTGTRPAGGDPTVQRMLSRDDPRSKQEIINLLFPHGKLLSNVK
jgi:hypothetical protein